jgi:hypothetical protein
VKNGVKITKKEENYSGFFLKPLGFRSPSPALLWHLCPFMGRQLLCKNNATIGFEL